MSDDFFEKLRNDARQLRFEPDDNVLWTRLAAGVRERVRGQTSVAQLLSRWFRPITASLVSLTLVAVLGITWFEWHEPSYTLEVMGSNSVEISIDGDTFSLAE
jgi:hypothetical protein